MIRSTGDPTAFAASAIARAALLVDAEIALKNCCAGVR